MARRLNYATLVDGRSNNPGGAWSYEGAVYMWDTGKWADMRGPHTSQSERCGPAVVLRLQNRGSSLHVDLQCTTVCVTNHVVEQLPWRPSNTRRDLVPRFRKSMLSICAAIHSKDYSVPTLLYARYLHPRERFTSEDRQRG